MSQRAGGLNLQSTQLDAFFWTSRIEKEVHRQESLVDRTDSTRSTVAPDRDPQVHICLFATSTPISKTLSFLTSFTLASTHIFCPFKSYFIYITTLYVFADSPWRPHCSQNSFTTKRFYYPYITSDLPLTQNQTGRRAQSARRGGSGEFSLFYFWNHLMGRFRAITYQV